MTPLSSLVLLMKNGTTADQNQDGRGLPATRIETISNGTINPKRVRFVELDEAGVERWRLQQGDILLSHINSVEHIGKSAIYQGVPETLIHGMNLLLLRPDPQVVLPEYLHFALRSSRVREIVRSRCKRAINQASINQKELGAIELPVSSLEGQRRIVDLLARAEGIFRLRREAEKKTAELIPALFLDMFGDPATNPKGWRKSQIMLLGKVITGGTPPTANEGMFGGDIPFITPGDLEIDTVSTKRFVTKEGAQHARTIRSGATMVCCIGATIGKTDRTWTFSSFNQQINGIDWDKLVVDDDYGLVCMRFFSHEVASRGSSTALPILKKSLFETIEIPVPAIEEQRRFAEQLASIRSIQCQQRSATTKAQATFDALLSQMFSN